MMGRPLEAASGRDPESAVAIRDLRDSFLAGSFLPVFFVDVVKGVKGVKGFRRNLFWFDTQGLWEMEIFYLSDVIVIMEC